MKKKSVMNPKTALLTSVLSMLLCVTMFVGTTFAWFSQDITNTKNNIMSGTLDVKLEYFDSSTGIDKWVEVDENTTIFDPDAKYEPGYTEVIYLRIVNNGSLALKYQLGVGVKSEEFGVNKAGESFKLSDYIMFGVVDTEVGVEANTFAFTKYNEDDAAREQARKDVADVAEKIGLGYRSKPAVLSSKDETDTNKYNPMDYLTMVVYMPTDVGNEANAQPGKEPKINLSIDLVAVQTQFEDDSFGIGYDKEADDRLPLPVANVNRMNPAQLQLINDSDIWLYDISNGFNKVNGVDVELDFAYSFKATDTEADLANNPYKEWIADFVVSFDRPIAAGSAGLAGQYEWAIQNWIAFDSPIDIAAGQEIYLLRDSGLDDNLTYLEVCRDVKTFNCGAYNKALANVGATMKVDLRLTNPDNATDYVVVGTYSHTFTAQEFGVTEEAPEATVEQYTDAPATGDAYNVTTGGSFTSTGKSYTLDSAYSFTPDTHTEETVLNSQYKDWFVDFSIHFDKAVAAESLVIGGQYEKWIPDTWVMLTAPDLGEQDGVALNANEKLFLLGSMCTGGVSNWTYDKIVGIEEFLCGVANLSDTNVGTVMTVELHLINPHYTAETIVISTVNYTLGTPAAINLAP